LPVAQNATRIFRKILRSREALPHSADTKKFAELRPDLSKQTTFRRIFRKILRLRQTAIGNLCKPQCPASNSIAPRRYCFRLATTKAGSAFL
jgi:hypothetical protein